MPLDTVQHSIHIRRKKNQRVFRNIARLWDIGKKAQSHQDILDGLHPWQDDITLKFENVLPVLLGIIGVLFCLLLLIQPSNIWLQFCLLIGLGCIFWAFITYEQDDPIEEVITFLEQESIAQRYQLAWQQPPQHLARILQPVYLIAHLKSLFPLFNLGNLSNEIRRYASTVWQDQQGKQHQVLVFEYRYVSETRIKDQNGNDYKVREVVRHLSGVFVFDVQLQGLAVTSNNKTFGAPYHVPWHTSDIRLNQKLNFFGSDAIQLARTLSPAMVLKLDDFFQHQQGDLLFHPERNTLCFLGNRNLFEISSKAKNIQDISALRGHLRTFKLPYLEQLQTDLIDFLD